MIHDLKHFSRFITWNIVIPIAIPIGAVFFTLLWISEGTISFGIIFGRPDFFLLSAMLSGETYAEIQCCDGDKQKGIHGVVWSFLSTLLPIICLLSAGIYFAAFASESVKTNPNLAATTVGFLALSILAAFISWLVFNNRFETPQRSVAQGGD